MEKTLRGRRNRRSGLTLGLAAILATGLGMMAPSASAAVTNDDRPLAPFTNVPYLEQDPDAFYNTVQHNIDSSPNMSLVANVPMQAGQATMSNLVFWDNYVAQGSYNGLVIYDISNPEAPTVVSNTLCAGYQGDLSKHGDLIFFSVDQSRNGSACGAGTVSANNVASWEGIRIFDVSNPASPAYVGNVKTRCGSHTHTQVPSKTDPNVVYLYNGSYDTSGSGYYCNNPHLRMEIIKVDVTDPASAAIEKEIFLWDNDPETDLPAPFTTADRVSGGASTTATVGCHDITAYPAKDLLAAACEGDGLLIDISDPLNPEVLDRVRDANFAFWHTAQFNNDATKMIFQDELGGGSSAVCQSTNPQYRGADAFYEIDADRKITLKSYYKIPRKQTNRENCVVHEGNILPIEGKDYFVQAFYQGGASVIDFTDIENPSEVGYFDRGPMSTTSNVTGGYWATYYKDGYIYGSEIGRGLDILKVTGAEFADAERYRYPNPYNPATQPEYSWGWKSAPVVPAGAKPSFAVTPAVEKGVTTTVTATAPAGSFAAGEFVDIWNPTLTAVVASTNADADGAVSVSFDVTAAYNGVMSFIARGDNNLDEGLFNVPVVVNFSDVAPTHQFYNEIAWGAANGITTGNNNGTFAPAEKISRQALIAFLYRAANPGTPAPACTSAPFTDVPASATFCPEIKWAKDNGITTGTVVGSDVFFNPGSLVKRQDAAVFIYRSLNPGETAPACDSAPFNDVAKSAVFCKEIAWAKANGIVNGFAGNIFKPGDAVARDAALAFLYRAYA